MVSVIIPNYNCAPLLARCISSVRNQTHRAWECIIVDDGSTDGSPEVLKRLVGTDPRFRLFLKEKNEGLPAARNLGIRESKGDSVTFIDSDDWVERLLLQELVVASQVHPKAGRIICPDYLEFPEKGWAWPHVIEPAGLHAPDSPHLFSGTGCDVGHSTGCLYVKDRIPCELKFPDVGIFEDMIFNMEVMFAGTYTFITRQYLYRYVRREGSLLSTVLTDQEAKRMMGILRKLEKKYDVDEQTRKRCELFLSNAMENRIVR